MADLLTQTKDAESSDSLPVKPMAPGIYPNIPFANYLNWPVLSQSSLKAGEKSMLHLKAAMDGELFAKPTDAMGLGSALHVAFLEPDQLPTRVVEWTGKTRNGHAWEDFQVEHEGKIILTPGYYANMLGMVASLRKHKVVRDWQNRMEAVEVAAVGDVFGTQMKGRCDAMTSDPMIDLKSTRSVDERTVANTVLNLGYDIQAAVYRKLFNRDRFVLLMVESTVPYDVCAFELSPTFLRRGEEKVQTLLEQYRFCLERDEWPGRDPENIIPLDPPKWAMAEDEITIDGEPAFS